MVLRQLFLFGLEQHLFVDSHFQELSVSLNLVLVQKSNELFVCEQRVVELVLHGFLEWDKLFVSFYSQKAVIHTLYRVLLF